MDQTFINWVLAAFSGLTGFLLNAMWQAVKDLQKSDKQIVEKMGEIEVLVAGDYIKKSEFQNIINTLFAKLDRIDEKIDRKADKS